MQRSILTESQYTRREEDTMGHPVHCNYSNAGHDICAAVSSEWPRGRTRDVAVPPAETANGPDTVRRTRVDDGQRGKEKKNGRFGGT